MYKVGVIGFGKIGKLRAGLVEKHPSLSLDSICESDAKQLQGFEGKIKCPVVSDYREVLSRKPAIVFVCTPNHLIGEIVIRALESGCNVFAEKPPGRSVEEAHSMHGAAMKNPRLKLKFGFNHRYHDSVIQAWRLIQSRRLGEIISIRGVYGKSGGADFAKEWRNDPLRSGGGILLDQGIHMLDLMRLFCGEFVEIKSFVETLFWNVGVEDNAFAIMKSENGRIATLHSSATLWNHTFEMAIGLEEGYLKLKGILSNSGTYGDETLTVARKTYDKETMGSPLEEVYHYRNDESWTREIDEFVDCISNGKPVQVGSSAEAVQVIDLVFRIYHSDASFSRRYRREIG